MSLALTVFIKSEPEYRMAQNYNDKEHTGQIKPLSTNFNGVSTLCQTWQTVRQFDGCTQSL